MERSVRLIKKSKDEQGNWKFFPVQTYANGKIKPDGRPGTFYIEWRDGKQRKRLSVGTDPADALAEAQRQRHRLALGLRAPEAKNGPTLAQAITDFLDEKNSQRKKKTHAAYKLALDYFLESCKKTKLADVTREDVLSFAAYCRDKGMHPRTAYNNYARVVTFLRHYDMALMKKGDSPSFVEEEPEVYEQAELDRFFAACTPEEWLIFQFFLCTGMREQEVIYAFINDISFESGTVRVAHKAQYNFLPKAYKGREIPIPERLIKPLRDYVKSRKDDCPLLFPTAGCNPKFDFLDMCKRIATRAKLNPDKFWLHKFRATFATRCLQGGVDLRTVQHWMGHSDIQSTMRYLRPARGQSVKAKVDAIFG